MKIEKRVVVNTLTFQPELTLVVTVPIERIQDAVTENGAANLTELEKAVLLLVENAHE